MENEEGGDEEEFKAGYWVFFLLAFGSGRYFDSATFDDDVAEVVETCAFLA